ncbi:tRNA-splicing endonuclease subunit tsp-4 [Apiospora phragmitis]|uniref:tRNA-splicing endonuclease subunit Sen34 n=1 Tax=Apiospora phragmitis TaxID=2905665 RepID=A0ABR1TAU1_9PEZI
MTSSSPRPHVRISKAANRYLVFDIDDVMYLRRNHNICSVFVGTMPQAPQQSAFMGLPIELMAEEAQVLVEKNVAFVVDDSNYHPARIAAAGPQDKQYIDAIKTVTGDAQRSMRESTEARKAMFAYKGASKKKEKKNKKAPDTQSSEDVTVASSADAEAAATSLFDTTPEPAAATTKNSPVTREAPEAWLATLTTSGALLTPSPGQEEPIASVDVPASYPLYAHLQDKGYFMMPGLRFGCDYNVYPGDPLRFHSHFQATGFEWNEDINLLDLVTGGRLGTNVKKSFLIGGRVESEERQKDEAETALDVRAFSIEWAAM